MKFQSELEIEESFIFYQANKWSIDLVQDIRTFTSDDFHNMIYELTYLNLK